MKILLVLLLLTVSTVAGKYCHKWYAPLPGDTCTKVANLYDITKDELVALNGYDSASCILGESVCLDRSDIKPRCWKWYSTVPGDNCWAIWTKHGMTQTQFFDYHGKSTCYPLYAKVDVCIKIWYDLNTIG